MNMIPLPPSLIPRPQSRHKTHEQCTIAVVQVYVNVENSLELLQQPKDGQNNVIAIAEPRGLIPVRGRGVVIDRMGATAGSF